MLQAPLSHRRLFVAIALPESVRTVVAGLATPLRHVRWTPLEQLHVTLRFLGNVVADKCDPLMKALSGLRVEPFLLPVEGVGVFPVKGPARVLWAGVGSGHPRLHQLRQR